MAKASERSIAQIKGKMHYFTGRPCACGHIAKRRTVNGSCVECERENDRKRIRPDGYGKSYYWKNREILGKRRRKNYLKHREARIAYSIQWQKNNLGNVNAKNALYRATLLQATPHWLTHSQYKEIRSLYREAAKKRLQVDHIIPLKSKTVCGLHVPWNLQILTQSKNCSKGNRYVDSE